MSIPHDVHAVYDGLFNTASGIVMNLNNPDPALFNIHDIAAGLSKICRFGGQINTFYSVAQHSILVCELAPQSLKLEALLHDAAEAYLGDVIKPLKVILGKSYTDIEDRFMEAISVHFMLDKEKLLRVKEYDTRALELEHEMFQRSNPVPWQLANIPSPTGFDPATIEKAFMSYYYNYA